MDGLQITGLSHSYGARKALDDVSFSLMPGQFCGLLGPNGAGKSTLFSLLTGLLGAPEGSILLDGLDISKERGELLSRIGVVFQDPTLELDMSVVQNMRYFAALHGLSGEKAGARIRSLLERFGLSERQNEKARALSGGLRRRMEIARALIHRPTLLLLDEPTNGLDIRARGQLVNDMHEICREGMMVLWASHLVDEFREDDRIIILHEGTKRFEGSAVDFGPGQSLAQHYLSLTGGEAA